MQDFSLFLWLLKLGALLNLYFLANTLVPPGAGPIPGCFPARSCRGVRLSLPVPEPVQGQRRLPRHAALLDLPDPSLATSAEIGFIYLLSAVLRGLNVDRLAWVDALSWWMVVQVVISQGFVWAAILSGRLALYFWEELGWRSWSRRTRSRASASGRSATRSATPESCFTSI